MARKRRKIEEVKPDMTPMIDVTFLLLIFFMCTLKFKVLEGKLGAYLPKDVGVNTSQAEPVEKVDIRLDVINPGNKMRRESLGGGEYREVPYTAEDAAQDPPRRFFYDSTRVIEYRVGPMRTRDLEKVTERLIQIRKAEPDKKATIDPRKGTTYADVTAALDAAMYAGYEDITFKGSFER